MKEDKFIRCGEFKTCPTCIKHNKKVYCDDCCHFVEWVLGRLRCQKVIDTYTSEPYDTPRQHYPAKIIENEIWSRYEKYNEDNHCPYYKRKWYKFWV